MINMSEMLGLGKVTKKVFNRSVLPYLDIEKVELDGITVELSQNTVVAHSPSIGVPPAALGFFSFHYSASNVASRFAKPTHMIIGIYLPLKTREDDLKVITENLGNEAKKYRVKIIAGQTATYCGLKIPLITSSCLGEPLRAPFKPKPGDKVLVIGEVGGEGVWLRELSDGIDSEKWRNFTPLPIITELQHCIDVKIIHDISEGGVKGALFELADSLEQGISIDSSEIIYSEGVKPVYGDPLRSPTYGTLVTVVAEQGLDLVKVICSKMGYPCSLVGSIVEKHGLRVDGVLIKEQKRVELDKIYGSMKTQDRIIAELDKAFNELVNTPGLSDLIPQVGMNLIYSKEEAEDTNDIAGLSGRVINAMGKPLACGELSYGASSFLASVILEARRFDSNKLSAVNIRGGEDIPERLHKLGLEVKILPSDIRGKGCPVALHLKNAEKLVNAYINPGNFGIEATTTLIGNNPHELVKILKRLINY